MATTPTTLLQHDRVQQECFNYLWNKYPETRHTFWHTSDELKPHKGESDSNFKKRIFYRKAIGVLPGVTDLVWYWKSVLYLFDIKLEGDRISEDQHVFINSIKEQGGEFYEINNVEQFIKIVDDVLL